MKKEYNYDEFYNYMLDNNLTIDDMAGFFNGVLDHMEKEEEKRKKAEEEKKQAEQLFEQKCEDVQYILEDIITLVRNYYPILVKNQYTEKEIRETAVSVIHTLDNFSKEFEALTKIKKIDYKNSTLDWEKYLKYLKS